MDEPNMFSGLAFCAGCGKPIVLYRASTIKEPQYCFKCYTYGKRGKTECSLHHIREQNLIQVVLDALRRVAHFARLKERQFAAYINQKNAGIAQGDELAATRVGRHVPQERRALRPV